MIPVIECAGEVWAVLVSAGDQWQSIEHGQAPYTTNLPPRAMETLRVFTQIFIVTLYVTTNLEYS